MSISEAQRKKDPHAGPHGSYPLDPEHLKAAWDLAGHAKDPDAVRRKILAYAREHGLMDHLPETARKATSSTISDLFNLSWQHETMEGDESQKRRLVAFAQEHNLLHLLPNDAHGLMHDMGVPHKHEGMEENHTHTVTKAYNPVAKSFYVAKSWSIGEVTYIEGWVSTEDRDIEKDIVPPEAFATSMKGYFDRRAPLSSNHGTKKYPVGHLQKSALVRDGTVFAEFEHPTDPAPFEHFPAKGTGWYARGVLTDTDAASAVSKGNIGAFSWIGNLHTYQPLEDGGRKYLEVNPLLESTIAAYPVNPQAQIIHSTGN